MSDCEESYDDYFELVAVDGESGEETGRVGVDRAALAADSDVFAQLFYSERFATPRRSVTLPGKRLADLAELVSCVAPVGAPLKQITALNARVLLELADEYLMGGLKERCETALAAATEGIGEALVTAADHGLKAALRALVPRVAKLGLNALEGLEPRLPVNVVAALYKQALVDRPWSLQTISSTSSDDYPHAHSYYCRADGSFSESECDRCLCDNISEGVRLSAVRCRLCNERYCADCVDKSVCCPDTKRLSTTTFGVQCTRCHDRRRLNDVCPCQLCSDNTFHTVPNRWEVEPRPCSCSLSQKASGLSLLD